MLYVFRVDTGDMLEMDMNLAPATVAELKGAIERTCRVAADKQVLLISGGESLDSQARVASYSAGTETNPIFLFSKTSLEDRSFTPDNEFYDVDMTEQVEQSLELQPSISTVVARTALAQSFCELGNHLARDCERIIHYQHLQQQGWSAAIANLEDMAAFFQERSMSFQKDFQAHLDVRDENLETLKNFQNELLTLAQIPILPPLLENAISLSGLDLETKRNTMTLLEWISAQDNQSSLQALAEQCTGFLQQTSPSLLEVLMDNVQSALSVANKQDMKEIKGLTERLCGLAVLNEKAKKKVQEQSELAKGFQQNQNRASNLGDTSILPDLCASHKKQLLVMNENHTYLKDVRSRCLKAKEELSHNLVVRMRWVAYAQNEMQKVGNNLMIYQESLRRSKRHLLIIRQVQRAPEMYCLATAEVVRRKKFSGSFFEWANDLSNRLLAMYNEESERRRDFKEQFGGHFLEALFPGLEDDPSSYATQAPEPFDLYLPDISEENMETLRSTLPELAFTASWTELSNVALMILSKTQGDSKSRVPLEERIAASVSQIGLSDEMDPNREADSGNDSENFAQKHESEKSLQEISDSLRARLCQASELFLSETSSLKGELSDLRSRSIADKDSIFQLISEIHSHVVLLTEAYVAELISVRKQLDVSEANASSRISELEKVIEGKDVALIDKEEAYRNYQQDAEKHITTLKISHEKEIASLKETFRIRESELRGNEERMRNEVEILNQTLEETKKDLENEIRKVNELNKNWADQLAKLEVQNAQIVAELEESAKTETKRLSEQVNELTQTLVKTELTAEVEMENRVKELESDHAKACREIEERTNSQHRKELEEIKAKHDAEIKELTDRLSGEHQAELQEVSQRLMNEYKNELGGLRSRFRLMSITSMEKSPSDSSLEKIERGDMIELVNHEAIMGQMREDAEIAQEKAVAEAVLAEQQRSKVRQEECMATARLRMEEEKQVWFGEAVSRAIAEREKQVEEELRAAKARMEEDRQLLLTEAVNIACAEKDRQIELMMERYKTLTTECQRHRDTVRRLTDSDHIRTGAGTVDPLLERLSNLEKKKRDLKDEMKLLRQLTKEAKSPFLQKALSTSQSSIQCTNSNAPLFPRTGAGTVDPLLERLSNLEKEKRELKDEMKLLRQMTKEAKILERRRRVDSETSMHRVSSSSDTDSKGAEVKEDDMSMSMSFAIMSESNYIREFGTSPELSRSVRSRMHRRSISIDVISREEPVLVVWNGEHGKYVVFQDSPTMYFLHPESLHALGLRKIPEKKWYALGIAVRKEYCSARRKDNRYKVADGAKFYRVVVKPLPSSYQQRENSETELPALPSASEDGDSLS